jgi:hypothetical protein
MEGRVTLLRGPRTPALVPIRISRLLLVVVILTVVLLPMPRAGAQAQPRLAISEFQWELTGTDRTREFWEVANLGDTAWDPNNHWLFRARPRDDSNARQIFIHVEGVQPIPPNGVLLIEWGRPVNDDNDDLDTTCTTGANYLCVPGIGFNDQFNTTDLEVDTAVAVYAPTPNNEAPTVDGGTMLAYYVQLGGADYLGTDLASVDKNEIGYTKAVKSGLWKDGDLPQPTYVQNWSRALRMGIGPYPADHGRKGSDYYATLAGHELLDADHMTNAIPNVPLPPNTPNRAGTPGKPNFLHPGLPINGQIATGLLSVRTAAVAASLAAGPPAALQVAGLGANGMVASSLYANNTWSPMTYVAAAPVADDLTLVNNPVRGSRTLIVRAKADGALTALTSTGSDGAFTGSADLGLKAKFAAVAVVDATGNEHYVAVDANGALQHNLNEGGKLRGWQAIAGATTDAPVAAAFTTDPPGVSVLAFIGNQLTLYRLGADGKFGPGTNVGAAVSERLAGIGPVMEWNTVAKRLEILAVVGALSDDTGAAVQHARVEVTSLGEAKVGALAAIGGIDTNAAPAIAIQGDSGDIRLLARGGGKERGLNASPVDAGYNVDPDPAGPHAGFVYESSFTGGAWSAPKRIGLGRLPGPTPALPLFTAPVSPVSLFDPNTKRFQDLLIGEDAQIYHNPVAP